MFSATLLSSGRTTAHVPSHFSSSLGKVTALLDREDRLSANCWTFDSKGVSESIVLNLKHPNVDTAALIMGEGTWVLRDKRINQGALYRRDASGMYGAMRRAALSEIALQTHRKPLHVFSRLEGNVDYLIVYVDAGLPGVKPKIELFTDIVGDMVMRAGSAEGLFRLSSNHPIVLFRKDGSVVEIVDDGRGKPIASTCDHVAALEHRLDYIQRMLQDATALSNSVAMYKREDWLCHQLVTMIEALQYVRGIDERNELQSKVVDLLVDLNDEGMLRMGVRAHLIRALDRCSDTVRWRFHSWQGMAVAEDKPLTPEQQHKRQERLTKRAHTLQLRAVNNRARLNGAAKAQNGQSKKNKDKKNKR